ncbi:MAG: glycosyltransferase family 2 protein, partial [Maritimibacter sp.]|nr:glycosyltransferase family 2 protein [Maritimibacter sp.]
MPLLSVIVTAYNIEAYLAECLETVVSQTLADMEIIVVDDGSTDGTPEIIRTFAARDARVKPVLLPENTIGGVASAANAGLERATGTWVGFVDGDDYLDPTMFEELCAAATACGAELAMCRYKEVVGPEKTLRDP